MRAQPEGHVVMPFILAGPLNFGKAELSHDVRDLQFSRPRADLHGPHVIYPARKIDAAAALLPDLRYHSIDAAPIVVRVLICLYRSDPRSPNDLTEGNVAGPHEEQALHGDRADSRKQLWPETIMDLDE